MSAASLPINVNAQSAMQRSIALLGETVTFARISGGAPNTFSFTAQIQAIVRNYQLDSGAARREGYGANELGGITQGDRQVIVLAQDLIDARYPGLPQKDDKITLARTGEQLSITRVDPSKRGIAGAIEIDAVGV